MSSLGTTALELALLFAGIAAFAGLWGHHRRSEALITLARRSIYAAATLVTLAVVVLIGLIFSNDFLVRMVQSSSSRSLDWYYKLALLWVDLESSILFWTWILALLAALAVRLHHRRLPDLTPHAGAVLMACLGFFLYLLLFQKSPFDEYLVEAPLVGAGMRPMLRNPWMLLHPPTQYLGYIATTVPFAYGLAALVRTHRPGHDQDDWLREMRPWILGGWLMLGVGLVLGMLWAYELIDWGGWWGWDPIENASLFPWLISTALVHASLTTLRRGGLLRGWTLFLVLVTFWLTIFGTFMTRSGFVRSVHSFGEDKGLFWSFVIFMGVGMAGFGLLIARFVEGRFGGKRVSGFFTLDFLMVVLLWLFVLAALVVLAGTLFPTVHEALYDKRVTVGPPFFQRFMAPLGLVILALMSIAPLLSFSPMSGRPFLDQLFWPLCAGVVVLLALPMALPSVFTSGRDASLFGLTVRLPGVTLSQVAIGLVALTLVAVLQQLLRLGRARARARGERLLAAVGHVLGKNRFRYAAHTVHIGAALMFLGFAGKPLVQHGDRVLEPGDLWHIGGVELQYSHLAHRQGAEAEALQAVILMREPGEAQGVPLVPYIKVFYENTSMPLNEPHILRRLGRDLHVRLADQQGNRVTLKVAVHPLVSWLWIGFGVMALGGLWGLLPRGWARRPARRPARCREEEEAEPLPRILGLAVWAIVLAWLLVLAFYLAKRVDPTAAAAAVSLWVVGALVLGGAVVILWAFLPLVRAGALTAPAPSGATAGAAGTLGALGAAGAAGLREQLIDALRLIRDEQDLGKVSAEEALGRARPLRWELGRLLASEDAEAKRAELETEVEAARRQGLNRGKAGEKQGKASPEEQR